MIRPKLPNVQDLTETQLIVCKRLMPYNIEWIKWIISNKNFGSASEKEWKDLLAFYEDYHIWLLNFRVRDESCNEEK